MANRGDKMIERTKTLVKMAGTKSGEFRQAFNALYDKWRIRTTAREISPDEFLEFFATWLLLRKLNMELLPGFPENQMTKELESLRDKLKESLIDFPLSVC